MKRLLRRSALLLACCATLVACKGLWGSLDNPPALVVTVPTNFTAVAGDGQVSLSWNAVSGAGPYSIYRSEVPGTKGSMIGSSFTTSYTDNNVTNGTTYYYEVTAQLSAGETDPSIQVGATPTSSIHDGPAGLMAVTGDGQVLLCWNALPSASSYDIYRSTTTGNEGSKIGNSSVARYTDTGLSNETTFYYKVAGLTADGELGRSNQIAATPRSSTATSISLDLSSLTVTIGEARMLAAGISSDATKPIIIWSSSDASIATVDSNGLVQGIAPGSATIIARTGDGGSFAICDVTVIAPVLLVPDTATSTWTTSSIEPGKTVQLEAVVSALSTPVQNVSWSTSDASIATVSNAGLVTGVTCGAATVTWISSDGSSSGTCTIRVKTHTVLTSDTTWSGTVTVTGNVSISGCTLTILPGTTVDIVPGIGAGIFIAGSGKLCAHGDPGQPIVFKAAYPVAMDASAWDGINRCSGDVDLSYCFVGDAVCGVYVGSAGGTIVITNTCFHKCGEGVCVFGTPTTIRNVTFDKCTWGYWGYVDNEVGYCEFKECSGDGVIVSESNTATGVSYSNFISNANDAEVFNFGNCVNVVLNLKGCCPATPKTMVYVATDSSSLITITNGSVGTIPAAGCRFDYSPLVTRSVLSPATKSIVGGDSFGQENSMEEADKRNRDLAAKLQGD